MNQTRIIVKYYDIRMLLTCDTNALFMVLFDEYGEGVVVEFVRMSESERCEVIQEVKGIPFIRERFHVFEASGTYEMQRRPDIEQSAVAKGVK